MAESEYSDGHDSRELCAAGVCGAQLGEISLLLYQMLAAFDDGDHESLLWRRHFCVRVLRTLMDCCRQAAQRG